jgi:hypothetical protein
MVALLKENLKTLLSEN